MVNLIKSLRDTIFSEEATEWLVELSEIGIDSVLENEILKEIPILKSITTLYHVVDRIKEKRLLKHTMAFVDSFNKGNLTKEEKDLYQKRLEKENSYLEDELERILFLLEENSEVIQSRILAKMYLAYIKGKLKWDKFCELSEANRRMFITDIRIMRIFERKEQYYQFRNDEKQQLVRLTGLGMLAEKESPAARDYNEIGNVELKYMRKVKDKQGFYYEEDYDDRLKYEVTNFGDLYLSFIEE